MSNPNQEVVPIKEEEPTYPSPKQTEPYLFPQPLQDKQPTETVFNGFENMDVVNDETEFMGFPLDPSVPVPNNEVTTTQATGSPNEDRLAILGAVADLFKKIEARNFYQEELIENGFRDVQLAIGSHLSQQVLNYNQELFVQNEQFRNQCQELRNQNQTLLEQVSRATDDSKQLTSQNDQLRGDLEDKEREFQIMDQQYQGLVTEQQKRLAEAASMRKKKEQPVEAATEVIANSAKVCDTEIKGQWKQLGYNIRSLALEVSKTKPAHGFNKTASSILLRVLENYEHALMDETLRDKIVQGLIWRMIDDDIWKGGENVRNGNATHLLRRFRLSLPAEGQKKEEDFNVRLWMTKGFAQFADLEPVDKSYFRNLINRRFSFFIPFVKGCGSSTLDKVWEQLHDVYESALEMDTMLLASRAHIEGIWDVSVLQDQHVAYDVALDLGTAEWRGRRRHGPVLFTISPVLRKWGNANGKGNDKSMTLAKASVVLRGGDNYSREMRTRFEMHSDWAFSSCIANVWWWRGQTRGRSNNADCLIAGLIAELTSRSRKLEQAWVLT